MNERTVMSALTPREWSLVCCLRDVPEGLLRGQVEALVKELLTFAAEPRCPESQADGVPCACAQGSCEDCQRVAASLARFRRMVAAPAGGDLA